MEDGAEQARLRGAAHAGVAPVGEGEEQGLGGPGPQAPHEALEGVATEEQFLREGHADEEPGAGEETVHRSGPLPFPVEAARGQDEKGGEEDEAQAEACAQQGFPRPSAVEAEADEGEAALLQAQADPGGEEHEEPQRHRLGECLTVDLQEGEGAMGGDGKT